MKDVLDKALDLMRKHPLIVVPQLVLFVILFAGMFDHNVRLILGKGDNIPIAGMFFLLAFFLGMAWEQAIINDRRTKAGLKILPVCGPEDDPKRHPELLEQAGDKKKAVRGGNSSKEGKDTGDKVMVWPELAGREFVAAIICFFGLMAWSILVDAPSGGAGFASSDSQPIQGSLVFSGAAGAARLFRSLDRRRGGAIPHHCWADGHPLCGLQYQELRLLFHQGTPCRFHHVHLRVPHVDGDHFHRDFLARTRHGRSTCPGNRGM